MIRSGWCPWCDGGPFRVPLIHVRAQHNMTREETRDAIGANYTESLTDSEYREWRSNKSREMVEQGTLPVLRSADRQRPRTTSVITKETRAVRLRSAWSRASAEKRTRRVTAYEKGMSVRELADLEGVAVRVMANALRRAGCVVIDQRKTRSSRRE